MAGNYLVARSEACGPFSVHRTLTDGKGTPLLVSAEEAARMAKEAAYLSVVFESELLSDVGKPQEGEEGKTYVVGDICRRDRENRVWVYRPLTGEDGKPIFMSEDDATRKARKLFENDTQGHIPEVLDAGPFFGQKTGMEYVPRVEED